MTECDYYWCQPCNCYFPLDYCPTGSYDYEEPEGNEAPDDPDAPDEPIYQEPVSAGCCGD